MDIINQRKAYAKINLHLEILNRRDDGYHNILSLMTHVEVFDLLKMTIAEKNNSAKSKISIINNGGTNSQIIDTIPEKNNLINKAASAYNNFNNNSIVFEIEKNIPSGAGLGGGSSDAATTLTLLNDHFKHYSNTELIRLATQIGADVPFCLHGGTAICSGIGEKIKQLHSHLKGSVIIINDDIHIGTNEAYQSLKRTKTATKTENEIKNKVAKLKNAIINNDYNLLKNECINDFEEVVFKKFPKIEYFKQKLYSLGSNFAIMTGSGSTIVGIFIDPEKAKKAKEVLDNEAKQVFLTRFI